MEPSNKFATMELDNLIGGTKGGRCLVLSRRDEVIGISDTEDIADLIPFLQEGYTIDNLGVVVEVHSWTVAVLRSKAFPYPD
jgi:hypothetical protein